MVPLLGPCCAETCLGTPGTSSKAHKRPIFPLYTQKLLHRACFHLLPHPAGQPQKAVEGQPGWQKQTCLMRAACGADQDLQCWPFRWPAHCPARAVLLS